MPGEQTPNNESDPPIEDHPDPIVEGLLAAYAQGVFPMANPGGDVHWYDPDPRGVIPLEDGGLRVSRSLRAKLRSGGLRVTSDLAFVDVMTACARVRPGQTGDESWIDDRIIDAYVRLFRAGHAHSIEAWVDDADGTRLVGGLYGVHLHGLFAGESMFSRPDLGGTDASKACLVWLWHHLRVRGFTLLDTQFTTDHLRSLGGIEIPRAEYRAALAAALDADAGWGVLGAPAV